MLMLMNSFYLHANLVTYLRQLRHEYLFIHYCATEAAHIRLLTSAVYKNERVSATVTSEMTEVSVPACTRRSRNCKCPWAVAYVTVRVRG